jgi:predicted negative regulator of RcsB-dependent stress response
MATHLDLEEQEQLDAIKHFWKRYGNLITWALIVVLGAYAAHTGYQWWQRDQATKAGALFDELERALQANDLERTVNVFGTLKERYPGTAHTEQAGLLAAKLQFDKGKPDDARTTLTWVADNAKEVEYRTMARLRLAALLLEQKKYDDALRQLDGASAPEFAGLVADRRGDVLLAQGKKDDAKAAYLRAQVALEEQANYRRLVDAKLAALGVAAPASAASATGAAR